MGKGDSMKEQVGNQSRMKEALRNLHSEDIYNIYTIEIKEWVSIKDILCTEVIYQDFFRHRTAYLVYS